MTDPLRRRLLASTLALPLGQLLPARAAALPFAAEHGALAALEARAHGRLGVAAFAPGGPALAYRGDVRFPMCSTF
jgi:beta-lactamase class A